MKRQKRQDIVAGLLLSCAILYLIFDSREAAAAAADGVFLCLRTVIPALFPFFVVSRLLIGSPLAQKLSQLLAPGMEKLFHLPGAGAPALVMGALGGYPTGAQTAAELYKNGQLTQDEAERLLAFCSNAGPGFVFGLLGSIFSPKLSALLFFAHIAGAFLSGILLRPKKWKAQNTISPIPKTNLSTAVRGALSAMATVCAYVVLFRVATGVLERLGQGFLPDTALLFLKGLLEITGGCTALKELPISLSTVITGEFFLSFGGLCVLCQTKSVLAAGGLTGRYYLFGKLLQSILASLIVFLVGKLSPGLFIITTAAMPSNHHGLLAATAYVAAAFFLFFLLWAVLCRKRAGKLEDNTL